MLELSKKWIDQLLTQPETGMGYQVVTIVLKDGRRFEQAVVDSGYVTRIKGVDGIPFIEPDIREISVTHNKWEFDEK